MWGKCCPNVRWSLGPTCQTTFPVAFSMMKIVLV
jgi:hypothetical protein